MKEIIKQNLIGVLSDGQFKPSNYIQMAYGEIASEIGFKDDFTKNVIDLFEFLLEPHKEKLMVQWLFT
jgi:hypothetical protein